jgi:hypothetical protein
VVSPLDLDHIVTATPTPASHPDAPTGRALALLTLGALGVVAAPLGLALVPGETSYYLSRETSMLLFGWMADHLISRNDADSDRAARDGNPIRGVAHLPVVVHGIFT